MKLTVSFLVCILCGPTLQDPSIDWRKDLDAARATAKKEGKPLLVVFR